MTLPSDDDLISTPAMNDNIFVNDNIFPSPTTNFSFLF